jgi:hypothetical protein
MENRYDLFRVEESGNRVWVETVYGLDKAKERLEVLSAFKPGKYKVFDRLEQKLVEPITILV